MNDHRDGDDRDADSNGHSTGDYTADADDDRGREQSTTLVLTWMPNGMDYGVRKMMQSTFKAEDTILNHKRILADLFQDCDGDGATKTLAVGGDQCCSHDVHG